MELNIGEDNKFLGGKIKNESKDGLSHSLENKNKFKDIENGGREVKSLLNSGFIIKNDEDFLCNTYGFIDKNVRNNYNNIFLRNNFVEVQGASFQSMTVYGRNTTIKNMIMSKDKFMEINLARKANNFGADNNFNNEFKLSDLTLKNYFSLKQNNINIDPDNISPGIIIIKHPDNYKKVEYSITEMPSVYNFNNGLQTGKGNPDNQKPSLGILRDYKKTTDGFKNVRVDIDGKNAIEMESIHNWQKIKDYVKTRDILHMNIEGKNLDKIQVHHITQLQDGGKENVKNYIALSEGTHKLVDSYKLLLDKNSSVYRELYNSKITNAKDNTVNMEEKNAKNIVSETGGLNLSDKIFLNSLKLEVESNSALRLNMLIDKPDKIKMLFMDQKTGEEFRLISAKAAIDNEEDKNIVKAALNNFIQELATSL
ncbi:MAG: hypothetical protein EVJ47_04780 [Candidatus Acidulodesulfobacterium ferriphilum]|uniref:Uncharacterized protein n=1 Tax=Candidatus Acidulodesulfobacterium ferriphilum TaxID=2597223 RepID=A0A519BB40_9DELT|nr:MAG: hypothetical protein EVJ47_04780 [Candidatus Acidulodesulfobacterium ferriphilum]